MQEKVSNDMQEMVSNRFLSSSSYCLKSLEEKQELNYGSLFTKERISVQVLERSAKVSEIIIKTTTDDNRYNRWKLIKTDENRYSQRLQSSIFIDFRYQSINCYWLISITSDFIDYRISSIGQAGRTIMPPTKVVSPTAPLLIQRSHRRPTRTNFYMKG